MQEILKGTPATLEVRIFNEGALTDLDATPTVVAVAGNGTTITGLGTVTRASVGVYRVDLPAQTACGTVKATWSGLLNTLPVAVVTFAEIVGNFLFTVAEARAKTISGAQTPLSSSTTYPDTTITEWRSTIAGIFERRTGRSWTRRYCRIEAPGTGTSRLPLSYGVRRDTAGNPVGGPGYLLDVGALISVTVGGVTVTPADVKVVGGTLFHTTGLWSAASDTDPLNVTVEYEYGPDPVPSEATENGLRMILAKAVPSNLSGFATSLSNPDGSQRFDQGFAFPTDVWEWLKASDYRVPIA